MSNSSLVYAVVRRASAVSAMFLLAAVAACSSSNSPNNGPDTFASGLAAEAQVREILANSCFDCQSNQRPTAWNARLAPSYLFGVAKAKQALDFSQWPAYATGRKRAELEAIATVVENQSMPPGDYDFVHPDARLNPEQRRLLVGWASSAILTTH